jgi:hypothetical protein
MKIKYFVLVIFACMYLQSNAQLKGFSIGPYAEFASPAGNFKETNTNGIGAGLGADIRLGRLGLTGSAGFIHFNGKTSSSDGISHRGINAIPIRAGLKYRFVPLLYTKLEGGIVKFPNGAASGFIISPGIGLRFLGLDVQAKYEAWLKENNTNFWGLKIGYNF